MSSPPFLRRVALGVASLALAAGGFVACSDSSDDSAPVVTASTTASTIPTTGAPPVTEAATTAPVPTTEVPATDAVVTEPADAPATESTAQTTYAYVVEVEAAVEAMVVYSETLEEDAELTDEQIEELMGYAAQVETALADAAVAVDGYEPSNPLVAGALEDAQAGFDDLASQLDSFTADVGSSSTTAADLQAQLAELSGISASISSQLQSALDSVPTASIPTVTIPEAPSPSLPSRP